VPHCFRKSADFRHAAIPELRRDTSERKKRLQEFVLAALLSESKGITRATNATVRLAQKGALV
jgi:hypothetical protein